MINAYESELQMLWLPVVFSSYPNYNGKSLRSWTKATLWNWPGNHYKSEMHFTIGICATCISFCCIWGIGSHISKWS